MNKMLSKEEIVLTIAELVEQEVISFHDWVENENIQWRDANGKEYTTKQLYKIYQQSKQQQP